MDNVEFKINEDYIVQTISKDFKSLVKIYIVIPTLLSPIILIVYKKFDYIFITLLLFLSFLKFLSFTIANFKEYKCIKLAIDGNKVIITGYHPVKKKIEEKTFDLNNVTSELFIDKWTFLKIYNKDKPVTTLFLHKEMWTLEQLNNIHKILKND
jgi:hypothetical protein